VLQGAPRQWLPAVGAVAGGADGEGGDANGHCWRLAAGVRSGEKVVPAFYRRRRSVWGEIFSGEKVTGEARAASRSGVRRRGVSSGGRSTCAGSARHVQLKFKIKNK
jgi:hypothetical protein